MVKIPSDTFFSMILIDDTIYSFQYTGISLVTHHRGKLRI